MDPIMTVLLGVVVLLYAILILLCGYFAYIAFRTGLVIGFIIAFALVIALVLVEAALLLTLFNGWNIVAPILSTIGMYR